ncbi:hypothetical protein QWY31_10375 [Cytophagales bacterium LB-30]|uniref:Uncharacterized protein n=1 Tax=Shiella aurantiaca TaxID=3058365 RepID=A0ABT8F645_9BACT|nr:hypothetical protein [Shiella aurantiaca]MDN4165910.1 hypothetical protein [Shiella aurantiaca]
MKTTINTQQENYIKDIVEAGFKKAATAFSSLAKREVSIDSVSLKYLENPHQLDHLLPIADSLVLLTTDMIGELKGKSYLVLSGEESEKVIQACSPMKLAHQEVELGDALLLELDNILSASVITEISNRLNLKIYGDIPSLKKCSGSMALDILKKDFLHYQNSQQEILLVSSTHFHFKNEVHLRPQFIWKFNQGLLQALNHSAVGSYQ